MNSNIGNKSAATTEFIPLNRHIYIDNDTDPNKTSSQSKLNQVDITFKNLNYKISYPNKNFTRS